MFIGIFKIKSSFRLFGWLNNFQSQRRAQRTSRFSGVICGTDLLMTTIICFQNLKKRQFLNCPSLIRLQINQILPITIKDDDCLQKHEVIQLSVLKTYLHSNMWLLRQLLEESGISVAGLLHQCWLLNWIPRPTSKRSI